MGVPPENSMLVIDDDEDRRLKLQTVLEFAGQNVILRTTKDQFNRAKDSIFAIIMTGLSYRQFGEVALADLYPDIPILLVDDGQINLLNAQQDDWRIVDVMDWPLRHEKMLMAIKACAGFSKRKAPSRILSDKCQAPIFVNFVGEDSNILKVRKSILQLTELDVNVLITGESGTGKEMVAKNIHHLSGRSKGKFVAVNCGAIPNDLLESELFGHEKGAFTGALNRRIGRFEVASGGTLFLDEIGDMPLAMQVKLLRVIEDMTFERIGSNTAIQADFRIIAATHCNLSHAIRDARFREDLFYRLNVFPIKIPPLRERVDDIPMLVQDILKKHEEKHRKRIRLSTSAINSFKQYSWPGNIRELANLLERLLVEFPNRIIDAADIQEKLPIPGRDQNEVVIERRRTDVAFSLKEHLNEVEATCIREALERAGGTVSQAAQHLGMGRTTLVEKMRKHGIRRDESDEALGT